MQAFNKYSLSEFHGKLGPLFRKFIFSVLSVGHIPNHIAFIMDGNRRYARKYNLKEGSGHRVGFLALTSMLKYCYELGVKYVTVYAFSIDNFKRSPEEVDHVMDLMCEKIEELLQKESVVNNFGVRIYFIGNLKLLTEPARLAAEKAMAATAKNNNFMLLICVAYTSTDEIVHAVQECYTEKCSEIQELDSSGSEGDLNEISCNENNQEKLIKLSDIERHMYMSVAPDPDIIVRTSGANRLSNFLLWQSTYSYLYSPAALWPEISLWHLIISTGGGSKALDRQREMILGNRRIWFGDVTVDDRYDPCSNESQMEMEFPLRRGKSTGLSLGFLIISFSLLQAVEVASSIALERSDSWFHLISNDMSREGLSQGYCAMHGICGKRIDGKVLNCPYESPSVKPDKLLSLKIQSLCPTISGNICCTEAQFDTLRAQVQQAIPFLVGCPACLRNFLNLFCELTCSPNQSQFINVTSVSRVNGRMTVDGIDFYVTDAFGQALYDSCKDVKYGTMNTRAIEFIGAGAKNFKELFAFFGRQAVLGVPGSPYAINFLSNTPMSSGMEPMNISAYSCSDTSLQCSCGDCPLSPVCSNSAPPPPNKNHSCSIRIGSLKVKCIEFSLAILYIGLASAFLGWGLYYRSQERCTASRVNQFLNTMNEHELHSVTKEKDEYHPMQMPKVVPRILKGIQTSAVQSYMSSFYRKYGIWVARNPGLVLCSSLGIVLLFCVGLIYFKVETRPEKLWVGHGSKAAEEKHFFDTHLSPFYRIEQLILGTVPGSKHDKSPSIVTEGNIKLLFEIQKKVNGIRADYSGSVVSLSDICLKPLGQDCATQSVLQYFQMDPKKFDDYGGIEHVEYCFQHYTSTKTCMSSFQGPLDPSTSLGGFSGNNFSEASAFIITYPVNNEIDQTGNENGKALAWEKAFIHLAKEELIPLVQSENLTLSFSSESSVQDELKRESTADATTILVSYIVMFAYISMTLGDAPHLSLFYYSSKVLLGLSGVMVVMLSVLGSVGFFSALGVHSTLIVMEVIPFLVLAVGVDNMCILVHAVKRQPLEFPLEERISNALVGVGPSITLASLSEVLAFAVGSIIPMPACRVFAMFAALAVLLNFLLQITAFVALITFDFLRSEDHRVDCFPCIKVSSSSSESNKGTGQKKPGLLARYMKEIHGPILGLWGVKIVVVALFVGLTFASIALSTTIEPGLEQKIVLPRDSYLQGYFNNVSEYLRIGPPLYFVVRNYNYSSESRHTNQLCSISQCDSNSLLNEIARASVVPESSYIAKPAASWLDDFLIWMSPEAFGCCREFTNGSYCPPNDQPPCCSPDEGSCGLGGMCKDCTTCFLHSDLRNNRPSTSQFEKKLPWFLNALPSADCAKGGHGAYTSSLYLNGYESDVIQASEFRTYHTPLNKQSDFVNSMRAAREFSAKVSDSLKMDVFPYAMFYIFFEQYLDIWRTALINISIALGAVFTVCLVITCSLRSSAIILLVLTMIVVDLMGVMAILGIQLNAISVVNLVMSIGIAVEFCVHITHAFLVTSGDREKRMKEALSTVGASVFSGITLTKLLGVMVLWFSKSEIFVVYFFQVYLALVLIGFLHGLVFLPVVLSICGPPSRCLQIEEKKQEEPMLACSPQLN